MRTSREHDRGTHEKGAAMQKHILPALLATIVAGLALATSAFAAAPGNTTPPTVSGTAKVGNTLTVSNGECDRQPDKLRLPLAAVLELDVVHEHLGRDCPDVRGSRSRRRPHVACGRHGDEC